MKNAARGGIFGEAIGAGLDAYAKLRRLLIAGARVEIIGSALLEFVAQAKLAAYVQANCGNRHTNGEPSNDLEGLGLLFIVEERQIIGFCTHKPDRSPVNMIAQLQLDASHSQEVRLQLWFDASLFD